MSESSGVSDGCVAAAVDGDRTAVERVLAAIRPLVVRYCRARLGGAGQSFPSADDVAQEVCVAVLTALPGYRTQGRPFLAFVYGIASHKVVDAQRAMFRSRSVPTADVPDRITGADGPEERVLQVELSTEMSKLLEILPEGHREVIIMRVVVGLSAEETAQAVGSTPGAVRVTQHRALTRLRRVMQEEELTAAGRRATAGDPRTSFLLRAAPPPPRTTSGAPAGADGDLDLDLTEAQGERLRAQLRSFTEGVASRIDVEAGLAEVRRAEVYRGFVARVSEGIDVEAGLAEALRLMRQADGSDEPEAV